MSNHPNVKNNKAHKGRHQFRIIAGQWRGRNLTFAQIDDIRPTADRVRETLFNWLQDEINGAHCLDVFAGSGALGLEGLSRGANHVDSLESSSQAIQAIQANLNLLGNTQMRLTQCNSLQWLATQDPIKPYDIVFLDPPFSTDYLHECCHLLSAKPWLSNKAFIYLESNISLSELDLPKQWQLIKTKKAGQVHYGYCRSI